MKPIVIIPALNPDEKLVTLVEQLKQYDLTTVIINDGSTPGYFRIRTAKARQHYSMRSCLLVKCC